MESSLSIITFENLHGIPSPTTRHHFDFDMPSATETRFLQVNGPLA